jgi:hypothetical protein
MTTCRDCQEPIQFLEGDKRPYDFVPRVHYANPIHKAWAKENSPAKKNGAKPKRAPVTKSVKVNPAIREVQAGLMNQGWKSRQVQGMLTELPAALLETADAETLIREVFTLRAAEMTKGGK